MRVLKGWEVGEIKGKHTTILKIFCNQKGGRRFGAPPPLISMTLTFTQYTVHSVANWGA